MALSDFDLQISKTALNIIEREDILTIEKVADILDRKYKYDKKTYRIINQRIYNALRTLQQYSWDTWCNYTKTSDYRKAYSLKEYYYSEEAEEIWQNDYFKKIYDKGIFTKQQIEESIIEALVFEDYVKDLKNKDILFTIAGKGNNTYRIPEFHDFCEYKYYNMTSTSRVLHKQINEFTEDGLMLPHGVEVPRLRDLNQNMFDALEYKKEAPESE